MTAQIAERLVYQKEEFAMRAEPLSDYFAKGGTKPKFRLSCSGLWRGYIGRWEIVDDRLYMTDLNGTLEDGTKATMATIFPGFPDHVFAQWYSGRIRIPQGEILVHGHMGYGSIYERDFLLDVERGALLATMMRQNKIEKSDDVDWFPF